MGDISVVELPERLDISCVESLHGQLEDALSAGGAIQLDASKVSKLDTTGIQVLKAFYDESQKLLLDFEWISPSDALLEVINFLNLGPSLGLND